MYVSGDSLWMPSHVAMEAERPRNLLLQAGDQGEPVA
jgi:hypothetical protein